MILDGHATRVAPLKKKGTDHYSSHQSAHSHHTPVTCSSFVSRSALECPGPSCPSMRLLSAPAAPTTATSTTDIAAATSPLFRAVTATDDGPLQRLLQEGHSVEVVNQYGDRPLHVAALFGQLSKVKLLVAHRASVNPQNLIGRTPLMVAARHGRADVVEYLLTEGRADPTLEEAHTRKTAAVLAMQYGHLALAQRLFAATAPKVPFGLQRFAPGGGGRA